jgi:hypothetical protein
MTDRIEVLRRAWTVLSSERQGSTALGAYAISDKPRLLRAVLKSEGSRGFLVGLSERERVTVPSNMSPDRASALAGELAYLDVPNLGPTRFLHIWCQDHRADQAFEAFCALFWTSLETLGVQAALQSCSEEFRRLLKSDGLRFNASAVGLVGELLFLKRLVSRDPVLLDAWTGHTGARHDFRRDKAAVEIKTTLRSMARGRTVRISDIDQLDAPEGGSLHLHLFRLERAMGGAISLKGLAREILDALEPEGAERFQAVINEKELDEEAGLASYELREEFVYHVVAGFPSLTSAKLSGESLDVGVSHVTYDLALEAAANFVVGSDESLRAILEVQA